MNRSKASRFEKCPQCGGEKRKLVACSNCGYSYIAAKGLMPKKESIKNKKPAV